MSTVTTPDDIVTPDSADPYDPVVDLGLMADSIQAALLTKPVRSVNRVVFTSSGTYTKPANLLFAEVEIWGGGGGGGYCGTCTSNQASAGSGGGAGGGRVAIIDNATMPGTVAVTVGAGGTAGVASTTTAAGGGGTTTFGALMTATGGQGGATISPNTTHGSSTARSTPGSSSGLGLNRQGGPTGVNSRFSNGTSAAFGVGGCGGTPAAMGAGGVSGNQGGGGGGTAPGGGGGGAMRSGAGGGADGGAGAEGWVIVTEYLAG